MNVIHTTNRSLWSRIKAHMRVHSLRYQIKVHEGDAEARVAELELLPIELDRLLDHLSELRVQLALAERET